MREILFGIAIGSVLGVLLYKKSDCAKEMIDKGEEIIMKEIEKAEKKAKNNAKNSEKNNTKSN